MIKVKYKDPYAGGFEVALPDDTPQEAIQELVDFLDRNAIDIQNADRRERYHTPYSTDALLYEGTDFADEDTPEGIFLAYEDKTEGNISEERFSRMTANYEEEQAQLESRVSELKRLMAAEKESVVNVDSFISLVKGHSEVKELTAEVIREFVEKVIVGQTERIDGVKTQHIKIVWNFIGEFVPPITENKKSA